MITNSKLISETDYSKKKNHTYNKKAKQTPIDSSIITRSMSKKRALEESSELNIKKNKITHPPVNDISENLALHIFSFLPFIDRPAFHQAILPLYKEGGPLFLTNKTISPFIQDRNSTNLIIHKEINSILHFSALQNPSIQNAILQIKSVLHTILYSNDSLELRLNDIKKELILFILKNNISHSELSNSSTYILQRAERQLIDTILQKNTAKEQEEALLQLSCTWYQKQDFASHLLALRILNYGTSKIENLSSLGEIGEIKELSSSYYPRGLWEEEIDLLSALIQKKPRIIANLPQWVRSRYEIPIRYLTAPSNQIFQQTDSRDQLFIFTILLARNEIDHIRHLLTITDNRTKEDLLDLLINTNRIDLAEEALATTSENTSLLTYQKCRLLIKRKDFDAAIFIANSLVEDLENNIIKESLREILRNLGAHSKAAAIL